MKFFVPFLLLLFAGESQIVWYHDCMPTASDYTVNEWKIGPANAATYKLRETIDPKGRVVELRFLKNGSTYENPLCYLPNKITYRYSKKTITETLYVNDAPMYASVCEMWHKSVYHIDNDGYIDKVVRHYVLDTDNNDSLKLKEIREWLPEFKQITHADQPLQIMFYNLSLAKMNGHYPVSKNYDFEKDRYRFSPVEASAIRVALQRQKHQE
jgi:hypothetical protein